MKNLDYNTLHLKNKDQMKNLDCNQIKIFINLEIIGKEKLYNFLKIKKNFCNLVKPLVVTTAFKPNFYYIVYQSLTRVMHEIVKQNLYTFTFIGTII